MYEKRDLSSNFYSAKGGKTILGILNQTCLASPDTIVRTYKLELDKSSDCEAQTTLYFPVGCCSRWWCCIALRLVHESTVADNRFVNVQLVISRDDKEYITCASETILRMVCRAREERPELRMGTGVTNDDEASRLPVAIENGERCLAVAELKQ